MVLYTVKRLLSAIPTLLIIIAVSFFMMRLAPGGPFTSERNVDPGNRGQSQREVQSR